MITTLGTPKSALSAPIGDHEAYERLMKLEEELSELEESVLYCTPSKTSVRGQRWIDFGEKLQKLFEDIGKDPLATRIYTGKIKRFEEDCSGGWDTIERLELSKRTYRRRLRAAWQSFPDLRKGYGAPEPEEPAPPPQAPPSDDGGSPPDDEPADASLPLPLLLGGSMAAGAAWLWWQASRVGS